jgi:hypothetical protein
MRLRLKGLNSITKKLADGTPRTYWYAWKGGPPLRGEPRHAGIHRELQRGGRHEKAAERQAAAKPYRLFPDHERVHSQHRRAHALRLRQADQDHRTEVR